MEEKILTQAHLENLENFLQKEEKSELTVEKYVRDAKRFIAYTDGRPVTKTITMSYKKELQEEGYAVASINSMLAAINRLFVMLGWDDCKVRHIRKQKELYCREVLKKEEYLRLLTASEADAQLHLMLETICSTGIRISEFRHFTVKAVSNGEVQVHCKGKTGEFSSQERSEKSCSQEHFIRLKRISLNWPTY